MRIAWDEMLYQMLRTQGRDVEIFLDGIKQSQVVSADEERGELTRMKEGLYTGHETLKGRVQIEIVRRAE